MTKDKKPVNDFFWPICGLVVFTLMLMVSIWCLFSFGFLGIHQ